MQGGERGEHMRHDDADSGPGLGIRTIKHSHRTFNYTILTESQIRELIKEEGRGEGSTG